MAMNDGERGQRELDQIKRRAQDAGIDPERVARALGHPRREVTERPVVETSAQPVLAGVRRRLRRGGGADGTQAPST